MRTSLELTRLDLFLVGQDIILSPNEYIVLWGTGDDIECQAFFVGDRKIR